MFANGTGVWSIHRFGDPGKDREAFRLCLLRALGTATHETGHILTMQHCIVHECGMNGANSLGESDCKPRHLCPTCLRKLCKYLPTSVEAQVACGLDEQQEADLPQRFSPEVPLELQARWIAYCWGGAVAEPSDAAQRRAVAAYRVRRGLPQKTRMNLAALMFARAAGGEPVAKMTSSSDMVSSVARMESP